MPNSRFTYAVYLYLYAMTSSLTPADALDNLVGLLEEHMYILEVGLGYCAFALYELQRLLSPICQSRFSHFEG